LYVYDGQIWLGRIEQDGDLGFAAFTTADGLLGSFENLKAAADAVAVAAGGGGA
jgi:alpha-acetolactate decarboxylase